MIKYDVIIIGSGPAGLSSAIYTSRARLKTLVIDQPMIPSQSLLTDRIENYPGFVDGINGFALIENIKKQAEKFGTEFLSVSEQPKISIQEHKCTRAQDYKFEVSVGSNADLSPHYAKSVIIATGRRAKPLGLENEQKFVGHGVSYCGTCDAPLFRDKTVVVIGGGNTALQETLYIAKFAKKIFLVHRRTEFRATKILQEKIYNISRHFSVGEMSNAGLIPHGNENTPEAKIEIITPAVVEKIVGENKVEKVSVKYLEDRGQGTEGRNKIKFNTHYSLLTNHQSLIIDCDGIFIFVGEIPNTDFVKDIVKLDENGYIITDDEMRTSVDGIFAAGDCRKSPLKQVITACGDGAVAAESVRKYLEER